MKGILCLAAIALTLLLTLLVSAQGESDKVLFREIVADMEEKNVKISQHSFFKWLGDESIPARRRMTFVPYWAYFALSFADVVNTWVYVPNPKNELEERINTYIHEDNFHYNFFLHDVENVLGYTLDRYGSFAAVMRHLWGDDSRAVREYIYAWIDCLNKYKDPIITLATFEAIEISVKPLVEVAYNKIFLPEFGLKEMQYFGETHVQLEMNHTQFNWFNEGDSRSPILPLENIEITALQRDRAIEISEEMLRR